MKSGSLNSQTRGLSVEEQMRWEEIRKRFPNEWVALFHYDQKDAEQIGGIVIAHHPDRQSFHEKIAKLLPTYGNLAIRFTGNLIRNTDIPLLWQISPIG